MNPPQIPGGGHTRDRDRAAEPLELARGASSGSTGTSSTSSPSGSSRSATSRASSGRLGGAAAPRPRLHLRARLRDARPHPDRGTSHRRVRGRRRRPLAVHLPGGQDGRQQPGAGRRPDLEGLLPAARPADRQGAQPGDRPGDLVRGRDRRRAALRGAASPRTLYLVPAFLLLGVVTTFALGSLLAAINVKYRDVQLVMPMLCRCLFFLTPVIYPATLVPGDWRYLYAVNPLSSAIEGIRWALFGTTATGGSRDGGLGRERAGPARRVHAATSSAPSTSSRTSYEHAISPSRSRGSASASRSGPARRRLQAAHRDDHRAAQVPRPQPTDPRVLGAARRRLRGQARRDLRDHRPQRRRQEHPAEDPLPDHPADRGGGAAARAGRRAARGRHRLPPRADRPREHLPQRRDPQHASGARSRPSSTRSSSSPTSGPSSTRR